MRFSFLLCLPLLLSGCDSITNIFSKKAPDEFRILTRAPLSMPPNYDLKPPLKGAENAGLAYTSGLETSEDQAREAVFGKHTSKNTSAAENALLREAHADKASDDIASQLDYETGKRIKHDESLLDDVLFWREPAGADALDLKKEKERLAKKGYVLTPTKKGIF